MRPYCVYTKPLSVIKKEKMKHWTEPNGVFIINIPTEWQYKNVVVQNGEEKSPYSFEPYENQFGCFQLSCYPLSEKGINPNLPHQKANSKLQWFEARMDDKEFDVFLWYAQVDDQLCMAKYIYSAIERKKSKTKKQLKKAIKVLESLRVISKPERIYAFNLNKYDNFLGSLMASYDLRENAFNTNSYVELIIIVSNQIDAFLRLSIVLNEQLKSKSNEIDLKYLFQADDERGIIERKIYKKAFEENIIDSDLNDKLNVLYNDRNRVIHRYIISHIKTREIVKIAYEYMMICEDVRLVCKEYEEKQFGKGFGIYGKGFSKEDEFDKNDQRIAFAMVNDKHQIEALQRKL